MVHERLHFRYDSNYPPAGSLHEKLVVVDDRVAFIGGIDLGPRRWDTSDHPPTTSGGCRRPGRPIGRFTTSRPSSRERWRDPRRICSPPVAAGDGRTARGAAKGR